MKTETRSAANSTRVNWWVDLALFTAILLALAPQFTGLAIHEWLSLALAGGAVVHLLLHWPWIVNVLRRFLEHTPWSARLNFVLNSILFMAFVVVSLSGVLISQEVLPFLGFELRADRTWEVLHRLSADAIVWMVGLHIALHWKWILNAFQRFMLNPIFKLGRKSAVQSAPVALQLKAR